MAEQSGKLWFARCARASFLFFSVTTLLQASELAAVFKGLADGIKGGQVTVAQARADLDFAAECCAVHSGTSMWQSQVVTSAINKARQEAAAQQLRARSKG